MRRPHSTQYKQRFIFRLDLFKSLEAAPTYRRAKLDPELRNINFRFNCHEAIEEDNSVGMKI
ncbi:hypothetical protein AWB80_03597 [Caballeronia pedi]|uniref:Uncharacterized protein n=1 Tax=Caballeronia pedi TaxID=1777141 RepID=A0A158BI38_9BURK|nr:hypothetical protein AWB80_03597 [Caballeronia pedi]